GDVCILGDGGSAPPRASRNSYPDHRPYCRRDEYGPRRLPGGRNGRSSGQALQARGAARYSLRPSALPTPPQEPVLDGATLDALRALPNRGTKDMLTHIGELYLLDSRALI